MPNWCENKLVVRGEEKDITKFKQLIDIGTVNVSGVPFYRAAFERQPTVRNFLLSNANLVLLLVTLSLISLDVSNFTDLLLWVFFHVLDKR